MKFMGLVKLIDRGEFSTSPTWYRILNDLTESIEAIEWPVGTGKFILHDDTGRGRGRGNGVTPIREIFQKNLSDRSGWMFERRIRIAAYKNPGKIDAVQKIGDKYFAVEWETGNVSSSHRALNKMAIGLLKNKLFGGILILPTRKMYNYLTDRVGNFAEIEPYLDLWRALPIKEGIFGIIKVEHDGVSKNVPRIQKGTNGRALV